MLIPLAAADMIALMCFETNKASARVRHLLLTLVKKFLLPGRQAV